MEEVMTSPKPRSWTFIIYMAGDNGKVFQTAAGPVRLMTEMTSAGYKDIWKMGQVGSTPAVAVTCLFDTLNGSYLVEVRKGNGMANSALQALPAVNMGDPENLRDFIIRSIAQYPAEHYALVLWNHGLGWLDLDIYARLRAGPGESPATTAPGRPPVFRSTPARIAGGEQTRPIAFDDSSKDFLDTEGLRSALSEAAAATGCRLSLIGMDACLMAMIEGARELAPFTDYFVASQEVEPMEGWPYAAILKAVNARPEMAPAALAQVIVDEYANSYSGKTRGDEPVTQSAIATANTECTEQLAAALVDALMYDPAPMMRTAAQKAVDRALTFQDRNYRDLGSFAAGLAAECTWLIHRNAPRVKAAAKALADHLAARGESAPVLRLGYLPAYEAATGLSVFLPRTLSSFRREETMKVYRKLVFPQRTGWDRLVEWLL
jgi:hypothetical protein